MDGSRDTARAGATERVRVTFSEQMLSELDAEAAYLGINRQAVIKTLCDEALTARRAARKQAAA